MITKRMLQCLALRAEGLLTKQIADKLGISERTVDAHFRVAKKLTDSKSSYHLVARYVAGEFNKEKRNEQLADTRKK